MIQSHRISWHQSASEPEVLGVSFDRLTFQETLDRIGSFIASGHFHQIATANTNFLVNSLSDPELQHILRAADLVTADGMPVVWASRMLGCPLPERVTGADLVPALAQRAAQQGWRVFLLGARPEVAQSARVKLEAQYPGLQIVGCLSPPASSLSDMDSAALLDTIEAARPDLLLVAFGNPKQEKWIYRNRGRLHRVGACIGVGGTFDFVAGSISRAPVWMQHHGLEWIYRLASEPRRLWKRYAHDFRIFTWRFLLQWIKVRVSQRSFSPQERNHASPSLH